MSKGLLLGRRASRAPHALWTALTEHEKSADIGHDVQDSFSFGALRAMAFEPLENPALHPENWKKLNAGLDVSVRLTDKGSLAIEVSPWAERDNRSSGPHRFVDFVAFPGQGSGRAGATGTIFEIQLDEVNLELRYASKDPDATAVNKRRLVFLSYEQVLNCLARHFDVRVQRALLCLGAECRLLIRTMATLDNPVERAQPWAADIEWHGNYLALCDKASVAPDELLEFFKTSLQPLGESLREGVLRQYLGKPAQRGYHSRGQRGTSDSTLELLRSLTVVGSPSAFPPLVGHPSQQIEALLLQMVKGTPHNGVKAIAEQYCIEAPDALHMLRQHYPNVLLEGLLSPADMRLELEYFVNERPDLLSIIEELQQRILLHLDRAWNLPGGNQRGVKRKKLGTACGLTGFQELTGWAQQYSPVITRWLESV